MDRVYIGIIACVITLILLGIRIPIGVAMGVVSFFGVWALTDFNAAWGIITAIPYSQIGDWNLSAVPMFYAMGFIAAKGGLTAGLFQAMRILIGRIPGGLASATVLASALFASASGSSVATAATFSRIAVPEMFKSKYDKGLATACVAASGTLGSLIPPSVLMIIYAIFVDTSVEQMFIGGVIPGIISALIYIGMITTRALINPNLAPKESKAYSKKEIKRAYYDIWPLPILIIGVLGGIMFGIFSPTAAGGVGAVLALVIALLRKSLSRNDIYISLIESAKGTSNVFILVVGASMFSRFLALSRLPNEMSNTFLAMSSNVFVLIIIMAAIFIILGMFIDAVSLMLLTLPIFQPILIDLGVNLIWFGILVIKLLEIGLITPPVGINVYVIKGSLGHEVQLPEIFRGVTWFLSMDFLTLTILMVFPWLTLWLPSLMG